MNGKQMSRKLNNNNKASVCLYECMCVCSGQWVCLYVCRHGLHRSLITLAILTGSDWHWTAITSIRGARVKGQGPRREPRCCLRTDDVRGSREGGGDHELQLISKKPELSCLFGLTRHPVSATPRPLNTARQSRCERSLVNPVMLVCVYTWCC